MGGVLTAGDSAANEIRGRRELFSAQYVASAQGRARQWP